VFFMATADGHGAWASDLRIPPMVERCVHYCAAHEIRNSFPLDTTLENGRYPPNCHEVFYPGVHSNVGGGYRPGEGGRNVNRFAMLSLVPLNAMYQEAVKAHVPLKALPTLDDKVRDDFLPATAEDRAARDTLHRRFNHYMSAVGWGGKPVGPTVCDHMRLYFRWRIVHVGRKLLARQQGRADWEAQRLAGYDRQIAAERGEKAAELARLNQAYAQALRARDAATQRLQPSNPLGYAERRAAYERAAAQADRLGWQRTQQQAAVGTLPKTAEELTAALDKYDRQFLDDSQRVRTADRRSLTPFEIVLLEAWEAQPLNDPELIAFFDEYVTDSLAGFDSDRTRATDCRWLYQGGDGTVVYGSDRAQAQRRPPSHERHAAPTTRPVGP